MTMCKLCLKLTRLCCEKSKAAVKQEQANQKKNWRTQKKNVVRRETDEWRTEHDKTKDVEQVCQCDNVCVCRCIPDTRWARTRQERAFSVCFPVCVCVCESRPNQLRKPISGRRPPDVQVVQNATSTQFRQVQAKGEQTSVKSAAKKAERLMIIRKNWWKSWRQNEWEEVQAINRNQSTAQQQPTGPDQTWSLRSGCPVYLLRSLIFLLFRFRRRIRFFFHLFLILLDWVV